MACCMTTRSVACDCDVCCGDCISVWQHTAILHAIKLFAGETAECFRPSRNATSSFCTANVSPASLVLVPGETVLAARAFLAAALLPPCQHPCPAVAVAAAAPAAAAAAAAPSGSAVACAAQLPRPAPTLMPLPALQLSLLAQLPAL